MAQSINECWSMDFMAEQLFQGRFRILTLVENFSRESLALRRRIGFVTKGLGAVKAERGFPHSIYVDNGPEFISKTLDWWAYWNQVQLDFSRPGKPMHNAFIESFNGKLRQECLNQHWFLSLEDSTRRAPILAAGLQWAPASQRLRRPDPDGVRDFSNGGLAPVGKPCSLVFQVAQTLGQSQRCLTLT